MSCRSLLNRFTGGTLGCRQGITQLLPHRVSNVAGINLSLSLSLFRSLQEAARPHGNYKHIYCMYSCLVVAPNNCGWQRKPSPGNLLKTEGRPLLLHKHNIPLPTTTRGVQRGFSLHYFLPEHIFRIPFSFDTSWVLAPVFPDACWTLPRQTCRPPRSQPWLICATEMSMISTRCGRAVKLQVRCSNNFF
jgi:hypothetical protein